MNKQEYERKRTIKEQEKRAAEKRRSALITERNKLKDAYQKLAQQKREFGRYKDQVNRDIANYPFWQGQRRNEFNRMVDLLVEDNNKLFQQIDRILDDMNWEINTYNKQIHDQETLISSLGNQIRSLRTFIENKFN